MELTLTKRRVWFEPFPGIGFEGVVKEWWLGKALFHRKLIYRDVGKCGAEYFGLDSAIAIPRPRKTN